MKKLLVTDLKFIHQDVEGNKTEVSLEDMLTLLKKQTSVRNPRYLHEILIDLLDAHEGMSGPDGDYWAEKKEGENLL